MLDSDKLALEQNTAAIKCKLIVKATNTLPEIILTEDDAIKDWVYTDDRYVPKQGFIGQFVARTLEGNLQNISDEFNIEGREIELFVGIVDLGSRIIHLTTEDGIILITEDGQNIKVRELTEDVVNWYSFGNFIVTNPEDDEVKDNTKFEAMDYTKLFNQRFDSKYTDDNFPESYQSIIERDETVTAIWLAKYTCAQVGVDFPQTDFTNANFSIYQNPFQAGESCRDVLKEISKLAYSWVRVGWDNKCYIDFDPRTEDTVDTYNIIDNNQYYTLETKKNVYGPINNVVVGMSGIDGESHSEKDQNSIDENGEHTIYIYDNPLTNTFELRQLAQQEAHKLFGLTYVHMTVETIGHPWLQGNERINVLNMEGGSNLTYAFNRSVNYAGHIRSTLDSMGDSEIEATLAYESNIVKNIRNASINVDKQNGKITALVEDIEEANGVINDKINRLEITSSSTISQISNVEKMVEKTNENLGLLDDKIDGVEVDFNDFKDNEYVQGIDNLQKQIDGAIQFWNGPEIPTLDNYPTNEWLTENDKINHQADIYTVIEDIDGEMKQGKSYRFDKVDGVWMWIELTDNELSAVQALAQEALDKAKQNAGDIVLLNSNVSKLEQTDTEISASVDSIQNTLVPTCDVSGSFITVTDSTDASLIKFEIEGKSTQETRSGKNLLPNVATSGNSNGLTFTINKDGTIRIKGTSSARTLFNINVLKPIILEANKQYTLSKKGNDESVEVYIRKSSVSELILSMGGTQKSKTFTNTYTENVFCYIAIPINVNLDVTIGLQLEEGSTATEYEPYGASPSPDYPSEIRSVGYENIFNKDTANYVSGNILNNNGSAIAYADGGYTKGFTEIEPNETYTINGFSSTKPKRAYYYDENKTFISKSAETNNPYLVFTTLENAKYIQIQSGNDETFEETILVKGEKQHSYIPYSKYGIEFKTVGKNLFGDITWITQTYSYFKLPKENIRYILAIKLKEGKTLPSDLYFGFSEKGKYDTQQTLKWVINNGQFSGSGKDGFIFRNNTNYEEYLNYISVYPSSYVNQLDDYFDIQLEEAETFTSYKPYQLNTSIMVLNEPPRSLPSGVKDIAYIRNNKLYVDRYVGGVVLDGSESGWFRGVANNEYYFGVPLPNQINSTDVIDNVLSDYFLTNGRSVKDGFYIYNGNLIIFNHDITTILDEFTTWLSTHNTKVQYELAEPYTEDYGEINYPITYKNITHVLTTDDLEPNMNITYVREGSMTDYIEGQFTNKDIIQNRKFSELSVTADGISATVTSVTQDLAETDSKINKLEAQLTDQEATLTIVSTHINKETGDLNVTEVTTTNGFTFNADGLNIYTDENTYNTRIDNEGTYYLDGEEVVGQTTKDGSILKNLSTQGQSNYSYDGNSYDFIEERVYADGEYCYATFYNGEE